MTPKKPSNHAKLIDDLKDKYNNAFQAKYTSDKFKIMFTNIDDFSEFKTICLKENIEYHTHIINTEKTLTVVLIDASAAKFTITLHPTVCVKSAGQHDIRSCNKTPDVKPPTCANHKGAHPANYSKCPALLAFLTASNVKTQHTHSFTQNPKQHKIAELISSDQLERLHKKSCQTQNKSPTTDYSRHGR
ncbi:hypothetical protein WN51_06542 [Melipona quadrifasciata]|uniref:Uncharacterized protein n=1 Tax=Melipona quadrifasciata TaxID=166423 RepID=A0A0N1IT70_9HYME|nr:hypothetical protein WN51_06542 [Melipona quadrifasciata]